MRCHGFAQALVALGADVTITNSEGKTVSQLLHLESRWLVLPPPFHALHISSSCCVNKRLVRRLTWSCSFVLQAAEVAAEDGHFEVANYLRGLVNLPPLNPADFQDAEEDGFGDDDSSEEGGDDRMEQEEEVEVEAAE